MNSSHNETMALFGIYLLLPYVTFFVFLLSYFVLFLIIKLSKYDLRFFFFPSFCFALPFSVVVGSFCFYLSIALHLQTAIVFWMILFFCPLIGILISKRIFITKISE
ncbi:hypothetical protein [Leptospira ilyithenensis]|uniref:Uncharacterized protein n=1 Tax=Leptospira ilyithenensis TaxID=2484901 RepID=A0A4R9LQU2_9LEPT|nr:hypothetical protein [Leptospira ilyithenensis]TGN11955.1 hypothetical protein EHS11_05460 [Leptospira ilyithenensis]